MYTKTTWVNRTAPYLEALNLNHMEKGISDNSNAIDAIGLGETAKGEWTPTVGTEYPTSPTLGDSYFITGLSTPYIFAGGDLSGETTDNQDKIYYSDSGWILVEQRNIPTDITKYVETMGDLSGVDTNTYTVAIVKEDGRGGTFVYDPALSGVNNGVTIFDGWVRQYTGAMFAEWAGVNEANADNTSNLQTIIDLVSSSGDGTIKFKDDATYTFTSVLYLKSNVTLDIGTTTIDLSDNTNFAPWYAMGTIGNEIELTSDATKGDTTINVPTAGLVADDWLLLMGDKGAALDEAGSTWRLGEVTGGTGSPYFAEPTQIKSITDADSLVIGSGLLFPNYSNTGTRGKSTVQKIDFIENVTINNGIFIAHNTGALDSDHAGCVRFYRSHNCNVLGTRFVMGHLSTSAIYVYESLRCNITAKAERPTSWEMINDHSTYNSFKDIGSWYCTYDVSDLNGSQGFDQSFMTDGVVSIYPTLKMHSVNAKQDGATTHGCCYGGKFNVTAIGAGYCAFRNRARYSDIQVNGVGDSNGNTGGLIFSGWGGLDTVVHDTYISSFGYGFEYRPEGVTAIAPPEMNLALENIVIRDCVSGYGIYFRSRPIGTVDENSTPANVRLKNITIENCSSDAISIGEYYCSFLLDDINITRPGTDGATRYGIELDALGAGHNLKNIRGFDIGANNPNNAMIKVPYTGSGDAFDRFGYTTLVDWQSCNITYEPGGGIGILSNVSLNTGIYKSTTAYTPTHNDVGQIVKLNSTLAITVTTEEITQIPRGSSIFFLQYGVGQITFAAGANTTLYTPDGTTTKAQGSIVTLTRFSSTEWSASGSMV